MSNMTRRNFLQASSLALGALAFPAVGRAASSSVEMTYGGSAWLGHYPAYVALKDGSFGKSGIDLRWESFGTSSARMTALMAGNVDVAGTGAVSAIALMARGARRFEIIGIPENFGRVEGLFSKEEVHSLEDLRGKSIGTTFASSAHLLVLDLISQAGMTVDKDVHVINVSAPEIPAALKAGQIDACATWTPYFNNVKRMPGMKLLADDTSFSLYKEFGVTPGPDVLVVSSAFKKQEDAVRHFLGAYFGACGTLKDRPELAVSALTELTKLSPEDQLQTIKDADWYTQEDQKALLNPNEKFVQGLQKLADMLVEYKQIDRSPAVKDWVNPGFI